MKKLLIVASIMLAIGALLVAFPLAGQFSGIQYKKRVQSDLGMAACEGNWLRAEHNGAITQVQDGNLSRISRLLTPSEAKHLLRVPDWTPEITMTLYNGDVIWLAADAQAEDYVVVVLEKHEGGRMAFAIQGYNLMKNIAKAVSPEGFSNENPILEGE